MYARVINAAGGTDRRRLLVEIFKTLINIDYVMHSGLESCITINELAKISFNYILHSSRGHSEEDSLDTYFVSRIYV